MLHFEINLIYDITNNSNLNTKNLSSFNFSNEGCYATYKNIDDWQERITKVEINLGDA